MQNKLLFIESAQSQNRNWFSYVVNDPVNYIDPFGLTSTDAGSGNSPKITFTSDIIQQTYIGDTQFNFSIDVSQLGSGSVASSNVTFSFGSTSQSSSNQSSFSKVTNGAIGVIIDAITPSPVKEFIGWVYENRSAIADTVWGGAEIVIGRTLDLGSGPLGMLAGAGSIFWTDGAALTYAPAIAISVAGASKATGLALTKQGKARYEKGSSSFTPRKSSDISQSAKDAKHIDGNSNANRFAQNKGYKDAHDFKNQVLKDANAKDKNVAHYDIYHNAKTGETFLKHKVTGIFIAE